MTIRETWGVAGTGAADDLTQDGVFDTDEELGAFLYSSRRSRSGPHPASLAP
jgi:hypothetical protein